MQVELNFDIITAASCTSAGLGPGKLFVDSTGCSTVTVAPRILLLLLRLCVLDAAYIAAGTVGLVDVVTSGAGPSTLYPWVPPSEVSCLTTLRDGSFCMSAKPSIDLVMAFNSLFVACLTKLRMVYFSVLLDAVTCYLRVNLDMIQCCVKRLIDPETRIVLISETTETLQQYFVHSSWSTYCSSD